MRAFMALGSHGDQLFKDVTAFAFKFINRHGITLHIGIGQLISISIVLLM
jgi:hypothetical protein